MKEIVNFKRCDKGHFFDAGKYDKCPHCASTEEPAVTKLADPKILEALNEKTQEQRPDAQSKTDAEEKEQTFTDVFSYSSPDKKEEFSINHDAKTENLTVHYFKRTLGVEPVVGWVVCVKGTHFGEDFRIKSGRNFIGGASSMNVCLCADKSVSKTRHAIITYDPKSGSFTIQSGDENETCYLNGELISKPCELKANDRISLGETELMFVPFCSEAFTWEKQNESI